MLRKYAISNSTEFFDDKKEAYNQIKDFTEKKYPFFSQRPDIPGIYDFDLELVAEDQKQVFEIAINIARLYKWAEIQIWQKAVDSTEKYENGIILNLIPEQNYKIKDMEIQLGYWSDWYFYQSSDLELVEKQKALENLNSVHNQTSEFYQNYVEQYLEPDDEENYENLITFLERNENEKIFNAEVIVTNYKKETILHETNAIINIELFEEWEKINIRVELNDNNKRLHTPDSYGIYWYNIKTRDKQLIIYDEFNDRILNVSKI